MIFLIYLSVTVWSLDKLAALSYTHYSVAPNVPQEILRHVVARRLSLQVEIDVPVSTSVRSNLNKLTRARTIGGKLE